MRTAAVYPVAVTSDPVPFPELGKADTRSGNGTGSHACDVPGCYAARAPDPVPVTERVSAFPSSVTGTGSSARNADLCSASLGRFPATTGAADESRGAGGRLATRQHRETGVEFGHER